MTPDEQAKIIQIIKDTIQEKVNGKIDRLNDILLDQNRRSDEFRKKMDDHIVRVEPVIKAYEDEKVFNKELSKKGGVIIKVGGVASAIGAIWFLIVHGLK